MAYAIIRSGGKQFRVSPGDIVRVPSLNDKNEGDSVQFTDVLIAGGESGLRVGAPTVAGAVVTGTVVKNGRGPKIIVSPPTAVKEGISCRAAGRAVGTL